MTGLLDRLREPGAGRVDLDAAERLEFHRATLARKPMTRDVFVECHRMLRGLADRHLPGRGAEIEIGAGAAPMGDTFPEIRPADVVFGRHLSCVLDAQRLGVRGASVRALYAQNAFHHFPEPRRFFRELERVLLPGGGAVLLDPYHGPFASFLFRRLFRSEGFDPDFPDWETPATGPMNGANQALSFLVFVRDRALFQRTYPSLEIVHEEPLTNWVRYLASGGLNFRPLAPAAAAGALRAVERALSPLRRVLALHHVVVLRKVAV